MMLLGIEGAIGAYLATLAGLSLSYALGSRIPLGVIARAAAVAALVPGCGPAGPIGTPGVC